VNVHPFAEAKKSHLQVSSPAFYADRSVNPSQRERAVVEPEAIVAEQVKVTGCHISP
jgi:hypothetical protein